ncbi:MAG: TetR/AcrR family transcriptional regulator [Elusimicrobia bacterium]|nr:TetR/AcrR family transcriptional regulator [Elusimicrobiota bacterium]
MNRPALERKSSRRRELMAAAFGCFVQYGYAKTVFEDVARKAGVSRSLLYSYFKDKKDLFLSVVKDCLDDARRRSDVVLGSRAPDREKLLQVMEIWCVELYAMGADSPHGGELLDEGTRAWEEVGVKYKEYLVRALARFVGGSEVSELIVLSVKGLQADRPSVLVLRRRIRLLAELGWQRRKT